MLLLLALTFLIASIATPAWAAPLASFAACSTSIAAPPTSPTAKTSLPRPRAGRRPSTDLGEAPGTAGRVGAPYDSAGRLYRVFIDGAAIPSFEYSYTANGSRAGATVDAQYRTTAYSGASYTYGPSGDRATRTVAGATTSYVYDARGNLRSVTTPSTTVEYLVDGLGRRVGRKLAGTLERGWIWAGNRIIAEVNPAGAITKRFVYATGRTAPDYMVEGASTYRIVTDQLGSVRAVLNAAGAVVLSISYDPFGKELAVTGTRSLLPFGFAGGLYDTATGLLRFGARDYDPDLGAWTTKDPSRFAGGLNLYGYANNDPVNFIDPTGFAPSAIDAWLFDIEESGGLDAVAGFGAGLLDNIPLWPGVPTSPTLGGIAAGLGLAAGRPASPCPGAAMSMADKGRSAGNLAGMLVLASAGSAAGGVAPAVHPAMELPGAANTITHIFGKSAHQLEGLVTHFGSREAAYTALYDATQVAVRAQGTTGVFQTAVNVAGQSVTVRGNVVDGVLRLSTAFVP